MATVKISRGLRSVFRPFNTACLRMSRSDVWSEKVELVSATVDSSGEADRELPLFLLGGVFYPHGTTVLNVFEMKYRYKYGALPTVL